MKKLLIILTVFIFDINSTIIVNLSDKDLELFSIKIPEERRPRRMIATNIQITSPLQYKEIAHGQNLLKIAVRDKSGKEFTKVKQIDLTTINYSENDILYIKDDDSIGVKQVSEEKIKELNQRKNDIDAKSDQIIQTILQTIEKLQKDIDLERTNAHDAKKQVIDQFVKEQIDELKKS